MSALDDRVAAINATRAKFSGRPHAWGASDCIRVAAFHARAMGHAVKLAPGGSYSTALGAKRALKRAGFASLEAAVDGVATLLRIPPLFALPGDLQMLRASADRFEALVIYLSPGVVLGFHEDVPDEGLTEIRLGSAGMPFAAWRV